MGLTHLPDYRQESNVMKQSDSTCPMCDSDQIQGTGLPEINGNNTVSHECQCDECHMSWINTYSLVSQDVSE